MESVLPITRIENVVKVTKNQLNLCYGDFQVKGVFTPATFTLASFVSFHTLKPLRSHLLISTTLRVLRSYNLKM